jgi:hypothetical protein
MSSSRLTILSASQGYMGQTSAVAQAQAAAYKKTTQLAAQASPLRNILAASAPGAVPTGLPAPGSAADPEIAALRKAANAACFGAATQNPEQCSILNQQLAAKQALSTAPGSAASAAIRAMKYQGSSQIDSYFRWPTWVSNTIPTTSAVGSVAITSSAVGKLGS